MATNPCHESDFACNLVWDRTGNAAAAHAAEYLVGRPTTVLALILGAVVVRWVVHRLIDRIARRAERGGFTGGLHRTRLGSLRVGSTSLADAVGRTGDSAERRVARARTLASLLKSVATGVIVTIAVLMILSELNLDITPILASAGIAGIALGFGAQSLVKDFLSGLFMIFEDQYGVGDTINLGEAVGVVEAVSLRVTRLRDASGTVWYVRNGEILRVANQSQNWSRAMVDIVVDSSADLARAQRVLTEVAQSLWLDDDINPVLVEAPEVMGVESVTGHGATVRVHIKTTPTEQLRVARIFRERAVAQLTAAGIPPPPPGLPTRVRPS